jgi:hypothetical protein
VERQISPVAGTGADNYLNTSASDQSRLSFDHPVARHLVHRAAMAEVFVSDALRISESHYLVGAQWPRDHAFYQPGENGQTDSLLFVETFRQAMVYLAHTFQQVPLGHHFIGRRLEFQITDPALLQAGPTPLSVRLDARWTTTGGRPPGRYEFRVDTDLIVGGARAGTAAVEVMVVDPRRYAMLRGPVGAKLGPAILPGAPVWPEQVGRGRPRDSVLRRGPETGQWWLAADPTHAVLFDHPTDHVPLMVLAEGFRQLGYQLTGQPGATLRGMSIECRAFAELDRPLALVVRTLDPVTRDVNGQRWVQVDAVQDGRMVAAGAMRWSAPEAVTKPRRVMATTGPAS